MPETLSVEEFQKRYSKPEPGAKALSVEEWQRKYQEPTASAPASPEKELGYFDPRNVLGTQIGMAKGAGSLVHGLGELASKVPLGRAGGTVADLAAALGAAPEYARFEEPKPEILRPRGPAQNVGYAAEKVGEALIPATKAAALTKGAGTLVRAATQGLTQAGVSAAQSGGDPKAIGIAGVVAAGAEAIAPSAGKVISWTAKGLKNWAVRQYAKAFGATTGADKEIAKKVAPKMIKGGEVGTRDMLQERAAGQVNQLQAALKTKWAQLKPGQSFDPKPLFQEIDGAIKEFYVKGTNVPKDEFAAKAITELQTLKMELFGLTRIVKGQGRELEWERLHDLRRWFDKLVSQKKGFAPAEVNTLAEETKTGTRKILANIYRKHINTGLPEIGAVNKEISFWIDVADLLDKSARKDLGGTVGYGLVGGTYGLLTGQGGPVERAKRAFMYGLATGGLRGLLGSTGWRTVSAVTKDRLADAIAAGNRKELNRIIQAATAEAAGHAVEE